MKIKVSKDLVLFLIFIPLFLWCTLSISNSLNNKVPYYSIDNKSKAGYSVFFETLKKLNIPVDRTLNFIEDFDTNSIQIVAQGGNFNINDANVEKWVSNGGVLVYLSTQNNLSTKYNKSSKVNGKMKIYKYDKGTIIMLNASYLTNETLINNTSQAYELLKEINNYKYEKICFNEAYFYTSIDKKSLWDSIPMEIKYLVYQFIVVLVAFFYYKGKRFGKVVPLYVEEERSENEYLYSAAALYRQAKCWDIMAENYYKNFLRKINYSNDEWLEYWNRENLPYIDKAKKVYEFMNIKQSRAKVKEYIEIVNMLEKLTNALEKRRDLYWKTLKKTQ
ncbi:DUF4350 domain-containing protein [Clostridium sp. JS66]|uniref:DUF4350 domain-containing protein n=1 Tax=Clostridium sp. JS66 TaxID=3064705 RepID=UPI00298E20F9|nr:DUF4350 domain-containing protein [Clostridium sp. JS66]WPC44567.1 DUF4350 domain-containing protein [Clostridium sp. JS66]